MISCAVMPYPHRLRLQILLQRLGGLVFALRLQSATSPQRGNCLQMLLLHQPLSRDRPQQQARFLRVNIATNRPHRDLRLVLIISNPVHGMFLVARVRWSGTHTVRNGGWFSKILTSTKSWLN